MDTQDLDTLAAVAAAGSLSRAARRLGVTTSTVARRLDALDAKLRLRLVERSSTGARLTPAGERINALAGPLLQRAGEIDLAAAALRAGASERPVRVSATELILSDVLAPAAARLWNPAAPFPLHLRSDPGIVSIAAHEADLAIRMTRPQGASLVTRKLAVIRLGAFASRDYLGPGEPGAVDLAAQRLLLLDDAWGAVPELDWHRAIAPAASVALRTGSIRALITAARGGAGIALLPRALVQEEGLVEVPLAVPLPSRTAWLVSHRETRRMPNVAAVRRWIAQVFAERFAS